MLCWVYCETNIDDCFSNACVNGVCRDGISGYECECESQQMTGTTVRCGVPVDSLGTFARSLPPCVTTQQISVRMEEHVWRGQGAGIILVYAHQPTRALFVSRRKHAIP